MAPPKKAHVYDTNQRVLCKHGNFFYEAKVVDKKDDPSGEVKYLIHYQGWHKRHDEWFPQSDTADKFKPFSDEALAAAKLEVKEASQSKSTKKKHKPDLDEDMRKSETGSRGSTPSDRAGGSTKANSTVSEKTNKGTSRGTKRRLSAAAPTPVGSNAFVEPMKDTFMRPTEIMIRLPQKLKQILVDDNDMINRQYKIIRLPAEHTVEMIIKDVRKFETPEQRRAGFLARQAKRDATDAVPTTLQTTPVHSQKEEMIAETPMPVDSPVEVHRSVSFVSPYAPWQTSFVATPSPLNKEASNHITSELKDLRLICDRAVQLLENKNRKHTD